MIRPQAREIVRYAKKHGITLTRGGVRYPELCARGVLACSLRIEQGTFNRSLTYMYEDDVYRKLGLTWQQISDLEEGFENGHNPEIARDHKNNRYFKVGKRVAELAGF